MDDITKQKQSAVVINKIFDVLQAIYPAFKNAWPTEQVFRNAKKEWLKALVENDITTIEQIKYGLKRIRSMTSPFVPTVGQFIEWCTPSPELLGLPTTYKAYEQACRFAYDVRYKAEDKNIHPVIYHATYYTGYSKLRELPRSHSLALFELEYKRAIEAYVTGDKLKEIPRALPDRPIAAANKEVARAHIEALKKML